MMVHADKYPWLNRYGSYCANVNLEFNPRDVAVDRDEGEEDPDDTGSTYDLLQKYWSEYGRVKYYPEGGVPDWDRRRNRYVTGAKWRDTRFLRQPPEARHHKIENETFRHYLATVACFAPGLSIPSHCTGIALPQRDQITASTKQSDVLDHVLHCASCSGRALVYRHDSMNHCLSRAFTKFGIPISREPKGLPKRNVNEYHKQRGKDGPDAITNGLEGLTAVEIHCTHQRFFHRETDYTKYCSVGASRSLKKVDYATFSKDYPGIHCEVFSVSAGGVIHNDTLKWLKSSIAPMASLNQGIGFMKMLKTEVTFAAAKSQGNVLQLVKLQKHSVR